MLFEDGSRAAIDLLDVKFEILDKVSGHWRLDFG